MNCSQNLILAIALVFMTALTKKSDANIIVEAFVGRIDFIKNSFDTKSQRARDTIKIINENYEENQKAMIFDCATIRLKNAYLKGTNYISESENTILNGIEDAKKLVLKNPETAKKLMQKAISSSRLSVFDSGPPFFISYGGALDCSNDGARQGLEKASELSQQAEFSILDTLDVIEKLVNQGIDETGSEAVETLFKTVDLAVDVGYEGAFNYIRESIKTAVQALRDAQSTPIQQGQIEYQNCEATGAVEDSDASVAIKSINKAANNALKRGANSDLIQKFREILICGIVEFVNITTKVNRTMENFKIIAENEPLTVIMTFFKYAEADREIIYKLATSLYSIIGYAAYESGKESSKEIKAAILAIERSIFEIFLGIKASEDLIISGLRYKSDLTKLAIDASAKAAVYTKIAFIQALVKCFKFVLSVI